MAVFETFAIGCFHFAAEDVQDFNSEIFDAKKYKSNVENILKSIDNVSNIVVEISDSFHAFPIDPSKKEYGRNGPFNPCPTDGIISFDLFIPFRLQEEVFYGESVENCERFSVRIFYGYEFPVTVVSPRDDRFKPSENGFSRSIPIIREFIDSKSKSSGSFKFTCMGPSPFHAEFLVNKSSPDGEPIRVEKSLGYDKIYITPRNNSDVSNIKESILNVSSHYYDAVYFRNASEEIRDAAEQSVLGVLERITEDNIVTRLLNFFKHSNKRDIATGYLALIELERLIERHLKSSKSNRSKLPHSVSESPMWEYVENILSDTKSDAKSGMDDIIKLSQTFETSSSNNYTVIAAGFISAALAFAATILAAALK
jgi:hypothetical protein